MQKKINFLIVSGSIALMLVGILYFWNQFTFYQKSKKAEGKIINISNSDTCSSALRGCMYSRKISYNFSDSSNRIIFATNDFFTPTLVAGAYTQGDAITVLYKPSNVQDALESFMWKSKFFLPSYEARIYSWAYWVYPFLIVFSGPLLYTVARRMRKEAVKSDKKIV